MELIKKNKKYIKLLKIRNKKAMSINTHSLFIASKDSLNKFYK